MYYHIKYIISERKYQSYPIRDVVFNKPKKQADLLLHKEINNSNIFWVLLMEEKRGNTDRETNWIKYLQVH